jgi:hypothetical protein
MEEVKRLFERSSHAGEDISACELMSGQPWVSTCIRYTSDGLMWNADLFGTGYHERRVRERRLQSLSMVSRPNRAERSAGNGGDQGDEL